MTQPVRQKYNIFRSIPAFSIWEKSWDHFPSSRIAPRWNSYPNDLEGWAPLWVIPILEYNKLNSNNELPLDCPWNGERVEAIVSRLFQGESGEIAPLAAGIGCSANPFREKWKEICSVFEYMTAQAGMRQ